MAARAKGLIRAAFEAWDEDANGTISRDELARVLQHLGDFKPADVDRILQEADTNHNGTIEYAEFVDWLLRPSAKLGAAAILSTSVLILRADATKHGDPARPRDGGEPRWEFGAAGSPRPILLPAAIALEREYTIAVWARFEPVAGQWAQLVGDTRDGWGLAIGLAPSGTLGVRDPRVDRDGKWLPPPTSSGSGAGARTGDLAFPVEPGRWALVVARGVCESVAPSPLGCTEFLVAYDRDAIRLLGSVEAVGSGLVLSEFGCQGAGVTDIASVAVWDKLLADEELRELFIWDAVRFDCISEDEANWLRLKRRRPPARSEEEEEALGKQLTATAAGKTEGVLDLSDIKLVDSDLPRVLGSVESGYDNVKALIMANNYLTEDGVTAHVAPFVARLSGPFRMDLRGNTDISSKAEKPLLEAARSLPAEWGCSIDLRGTKVGGEAMQRLLNQGEDTVEAAWLADKERKQTAARCAEYDAKQAELIANWEKEVVGSVTLQGDLAEKWETMDAAPTEEAWLRDSPAHFEQLCVIRKRLTKQCQSLYDEPGSQHKAWATSSGAPPAHCSSGNLIKHFSYLSCSARPRPPEDFSLRLRAPGEVLPANIRHAEAIGLHAAVERGLVHIVSATGKGYGHGCLTLRLENVSDAPVRIQVPAGTIFSQTTWNHRQNLVVVWTAHFHLKQGETKERRIGAFGMNVTCANPADDPMHLTALLCEDKNVLRSQGKVWEFFGGLFEKYKREEGIDDDAKKKKKKGKAKAKSKKTK